MSGPPPRTRTSRYLGGLATGLANQVLTLLVGLWVTRFALARVGQDGYGLWLVALQVMGYLALADLGVVGVLPRQTAFAAGRDDPAAVSALVGETVRLIWWQTPLVLLAAGAAWAVIPTHWEGVRPALAIVLVAFVVGFPFRVFGAVLTGLQDLAFLGAAQLGVWAASTAALVGLLYAGAGIQALAWGWAVTQLLQPALCLARLWRRYPDALPRRLPELTAAAAWEHLRRALWVSIGQVASMLSGGIDVLVVGAVLGPAAVVPYACTYKLVSVAANVPMMLSHTAGPALSDLRMRETPQRLFDVATALSQAVLLASGAIACLVAVVNAGFVRWWVGTHLYGGIALTALFIALMLLRHWGTAVVFAVYSFGHERRLAFTGLAEGLVTAGATILLVRQLGLVGAPLGALLGAAGVTLPMVLPVLARETGTTVARLLAALAPWMVRLAPLVGAGLVWQHTASPRSLPALVLAAVVTTAVFAVVAGPLALRPPLRAYALTALDAAWPVRLGTAPWRRTTGGR